ncbi:MAG: ion channel [Alphaproteobacteria bacterium]
MFEIVAMAVACVMVLIVVLVHYETMLLVSDRLVPWGLRHAQGRRTIVLSIMALMLGHVVEIWLLAGVLWLMSYVPEFGGFGGSFIGGFYDYIYFSAVNYTSLGYGDIFPLGGMRILAVTETLSGLMMIAWSASFTYLKMEQIWQIRSSNKHYISTTIER